MKDDILVVDHVTNYYADNKLGIFSKPGRKQVLNDVSFAIHKDEFFGLVGESGCGKSTLAQAILGLIPFEGSIKIDGMEYASTDRKMISSRIQAVFQDPMSSLDPRRTIGATMREPLIAHGIGSKQEQERSVREMLERVGLDASYSDRYPRELSGGQRQRVCIGAALMLEPKLIVADEAVSALDVSVAAQILNLFRTIDAKSEFAMLFISHNLGIEYYLCDRIAVMYSGNIVEIGTADDIYKHPAHPYTKLLLSAIPDMGKKEENGSADEQATVGHDAGSGPNDVRTGSVPAGACCYYARCPKACDRCLRHQELKKVMNGDDRKSNEPNQFAEDSHGEHFVSCCLQASLESA